MAQEEHVDLWTSQDAAQAAHLGIGAAAFHDGSYSDTPHDCGATDAASAVGSHASAAAAAAMNELGPSVSGGLSSCSLHPADDASHEHASHEDDSAPSHEHAHDASRSAFSGHAGSSSDTARQTPAAAAAAAAGAQLEAAVATVAAAAAEARLGSLTSPLSSPAAMAPAAVAAMASPVAAVTVRGLGDSERVPSSPSLASWRRSPDEVAVQDQGSQAGADDNPYVTMTGAFDDQGYDLDAAAAAAAAAAGSDGRSGASLAVSPEKGGKRMRQGAGSVGVKSRLRDAASDVASAAVAAVTAAVARAKAVAADADAALASGAAQGSEQQQEQGQQQEEAAEAEGEQQQQQGPGSWFTSYTAWASDQANWASSKASETWQSQPVQVSEGCYFG
jgi:hypothetical protein